MNIKATTFRQLSTRERRIAARTSSKIYYISSMKIGILRIKYDHNIDSIREGNAGYQRAPFQKYPNYNRWFSNLNKIRINCTNGLKILLKRERQVISAHLFKSVSVDQNTYTFQK